MRWVAGTTRRSNSRKRSRGIENLHRPARQARQRSAREFLEDEEGWKRKIGYGRRWVVEGTFSNLKRFFGEFVMAQKLGNTAKEMLLKAFCYNLLINLSALG